MGKYVDGRRLEPCNGDRKIGLHESMNRFGDVLRVRSMNLPIP